MLNANNVLSNRSTQRKIQVQSVGLSRTGPTPRRRADAFLISETEGTGKLLALAECGFSGSVDDGRLALGLIQEALRRPSGRPIGERLLNGVAGADDMIRSCADLRDAKSKVTAICIAENKVHMTAIGESAAFLLRDGRLLQLTAPTRSWPEIDDLDDKRPEVPMIRDAGFDSSAALVRQFYLQPDDYLILASDGLSRNVAKAEIAEIVSVNPDLGVAAEKLIALAAGRDKQTAMTAVIARASLAMVASATFGGVNWYRTASRAA